jgi:protein-disulfide isomerase
MLQRLRTVLEMASMVAVIAGAGALVWMVVDRQQAPDGTAPIEDVSGAIGAAHLTNVRGTGPIALVEFADFQCPACAQFASTVLPDVDRQLIQTGKVRHVAMHYPLTSVHPQAMAAAVAAECAAEQGKFWTMHDVLYEDQARLAEAEIGRFSGAMVWARLDQDRFEACRNSDAPVAKVKADAAEAVRLKVSATPTLFLGRVRKDGGVDLVKRITGGLSADQLAEEVGKL